MTWCKSKDDIDYCSKCGSKLNYDEGAICDACMEIIIKAMKKENIDNRYHNFRGVRKFFKKQEADDE
jgi:predicted amidophosphoribosyltransferase